MTRSPSGRWKLVVRLFRHNQAIVGGLIVVLLIITSLIGPAFAPYDPYSRNLSQRDRPPSPENLFGTDYLGRDIFSRILHGASITLQIGVISVFISVVGGTSIGLISGYWGGRVDLLAMGLVDIMLAFPGFVLAIMIVAVLGPSLENAMIAVGIRGIPVFARLVRGETLSIKGRDYIEAAKATGASHCHTIYRHILPNAVPTIIIQASLQFPSALLTAAALSFMGLGAQPPLPEWGRLLAGSKAYMVTAPWMLYFPGAAIMITVLGFNLLGNALRDVLDPRLRH